MSATALLITGLAAGGLGTITQAAGQASEIGAKADMASAMSKVNDYNAKVQLEKAKYSRDNAKTKTDEHRKSVRQLIGSQRAAAGASGVVADVGSPMDLLKASAMQGEYDAQVLLYQGELEAWGHERQADIDKATASSYRAQASSLRSAKPWAIGSTLLTGAAGIANRASQLY